MVQNIKIERAKNRLYCQAMILLIESNLSLGKIIYIFGVHLTLFPSW